MTRFVVDETWRRDGAVVTAGSPLSRFTFSGTAFVQRLESGVDMGDTNTELVSRLLDAGAIHPLPGPHPFGPRDVTVVVPARAESPADLDSLARLVAALPVDAPVIIVDDASPLTIPASGRARVVRQPERRGPAAARNAGLGRATTPFVAFIDLDVEPHAHLLDDLLAWCVDERVGLVAPRIESRPGEGLLARYERARSPLDLGGAEARVRAGTRVAYVPSAMWLCRTEALRAIGGFDESMPTGEDVDAVWRLDRAGWRCRYQPTATCLHDPRTTWAAWCVQRAGYGQSAAALAARHGRLVAPARTTPMVAAAWFVGALVSPLTGVLVASLDAVRLSRRLRPVANAEVIRLTARNHGHAAAMFASALTRSWWPIALAIALVSRRVRRTLILATVIPAAVEWRRRRATIDPVRFLAIRMLDDAAYGYGVWQGMRKHRSAAAVLPAITDG
jgi:mycofactocin system glycosyltransferase